MFDSTRELTTNKLILLYLLNKIHIPLSHAQITHFIMEKGYIDYFSLQQYLTELSDSKLVSKEQDDNTTRYTIADNGINTLEYFSNRIPESIKQEIDKYIQKNRRRLKNEMEVTAEYFPNDSNEYIVNCKIKENDRTLINIEINTASKEQARNICSNWENNAQTLYQSILVSLTSPSSK
ncbi:MAG: DUF4364 family protein [Epulopiscium sp.]|mgnify:CR=1 FL=1|nr:DUF4364 family protein [Candidatus Epulonipiscium sp.]